VKSVFFLFHAAAMLLFYIIQRITTRVLYFPQIYNYTSLCGPIASGTSVDPTSQVCSSAMLVLPIAENLKVRF
jgi:hypothetical protein